MNKNLLPLVSDGVCDSITQSLDSSDITIWVKELKRIKRNNPIIAEFIDVWSRVSDCKNDGLHILTGCIIVYRLLESQAEADIMSEEIRL